MANKKKNNSQGSGRKGEDKTPERESLEERILRSLDPEEEKRLAIAGRDLLIEAWKARNLLYSELFGRPAWVSPENYGPPSPEIEPSPSDRSDPGGSGDPGDPSLADQHLAVLAYGPDPLRPYWTYVTAGLCSPWLQTEPDEVSGFGCELMIKSRVDAPWAAQVLRSMAFYVFNHAGTISPGVRIALHAPLAPNTDSKVRNLFVWYADEAPDCWYQLPSGGFGLFTAVGITDDELAFAESIDEYGTWCIQEVLRKTGIGQVSDPERGSVMQLEAIEEILSSVKTFSDNFRLSGMADLT
jgi:hypothetical protein